MLSFEALGRPITQGSKSLVRCRNGRTALVESAKGLKPWRSVVASAAVEAGAVVTDQPVWLCIIARYTRPASHLKRDGTPRAGAPLRPTYGDADKLARAICDALTGIAYRDDRQVAVLRVERVWCEEGEPESALVTLGELTS